jgi:hypothetical protein
MCSGSFPCVVPVALAWYGGWVFEICVDSRQVLVEHLSAHSARFQRAAGVQHLVHPPTHNFHSFSLVRSLAAGQRRAPSRGKSTRRAV